MDAVTESLASTVGHRIRRGRQDRGWTLDRLAEAAGVSRRMLINVEQGTVNPSLGTLLKLSDALGLGLPMLVGTPEPGVPTLTPAGEGADLWTGEAGGRGTLLAGTEAPNVLELWEWVLEPGERWSTDGDAAGTREVLQVHDGTTTVQVRDEVFTLSIGDTLALPGDVPHSYANLEAATTRFSLAVSEPGVGTDRRPNLAEPSNQPGVLR